MKTNPLKLALIATVVTSFTFAPAAFAGQSNQHWKSGGHGHKQNHHQQYKKKHHNNHGNHHGKRHHRKAKHIIGGIIGGVVLGSIIHNNNHRRSTHNNHHNVHYTNYRYSNYNQYDDSRYYSHQTPVIVNKTVVVNQTPTQTYRVLNGSDCFLVNVNPNGSEILTQVPNVNCGF